MGVYRAGFAKNQADYEEASRNLFDTFEKLDQRLAGKRYLTGNTLTEADWRLFTTLVRFVFATGVCSVNCLFELLTLTITTM